MPQGLGKNLYPDLSVRENIEFFGRLFGAIPAERQWKNFRAFAEHGTCAVRRSSGEEAVGRHAAELGLCCSLIHDPDLLILDEPTTASIRFSRRQFWELIDRMRSRRSGMSVMVATLMEEAERFDFARCHERRKILATGSPAETQGAEACEDRRRCVHRTAAGQMRLGIGGSRCRPHRILDAEPVIVARDLSCRFGDFTAVDRVSFDHRAWRNFRLRRLERVRQDHDDEDAHRLVGADRRRGAPVRKSVDAGDMNSRRRVGYMSQSFSLIRAHGLAEPGASRAAFPLPAKKARRASANLSNSSA